ncbi:MAG: HigA family addiction module antitoxin [Burkholderiaceae bacterium]|nr:HigA family addiction module antitoxin [Burkholderiaceae bacterium]
MFDDIMMAKLGAKTGRRRLRAAPAALGAAGPMTARSAPRLTARRAPPHPGYFLETRFLKPLGITQQALASTLGISRRRVNELIRGHRGITADTAVRLAMYFGNEASFWMQLQTDWDLHEAAKRLQG